MTTSDNPYAAPPTDYREPYRKPWIVRFLDAVLMLVGIVTVIITVGIVVLSAGLVSYGLNLMFDHDNAIRVLFSSSLTTAVFWSCKMIISRGK